MIQSVFPFIMVLTIAIVYALQAGLFIIDHFRKDRNA